MGDSWVAAENLHSATVFTCRESSALDEALGLRDGAHGDHGIDPAYGGRMAPLHEHQSETTAPQHRSPPNLSHKELATKVTAAGRWEEVR